MRSLCSLVLGLLLGACTVQLDDRAGRGCDSEHPCADGRVCERKQCVAGVEATALSIVPGTVRLDPGESLLLAGFARASTGTQLHHRLIRYSVRDPAIATVSPGGRVTAIAPGVTELEATADAVTVKVPVRVDPADLPANVYVAPDGSDEGVCLDTAPCATLERAYLVANPGQVIELGAGQYAPQWLHRRTSAGGEAILVRPARGAEVVLPDLSTDAQNVIVRGVTIGQLNFEPGSRDLTFFSTVISPGGFGGGRDADRIAILGSTIGPGNPNEYSIIGAQRELNLSGNRFTTYANTEERGCCGTCLLVTGGDGVAVRANRFEKCGDVGLALTQWGENEAPTNVLVENNFIHVEPEGRGTSLSLGDAPFANVLIRNNSMTGTIETSPEPTATEVEIAGNIAIFPSFCFPGARFRSNLWEGGTCDEGRELDGVPHFKDLAAFDLHLLPTSPGHDAMSASDAPEEDIDGEPRASGGMVEIGADERP
jgi:hypothetical protein